MSVDKTGDHTMQTLLVQYGFLALKVLLLLAMGFVLARYFKNRFYTFCKTHVKDPTLVLYLVNLLYGALLLVLGIILLSILGVPSASLLTILGAGSLAIGLALKDSLSNIASGMLLAVLKPFKLGDYVNISNTQGTIEAINLFTTELKTPNHQAVFIPNKNVMNGNIENFTKHPNRRIDLTLSIPYQSDIEQTKQLIMTLLTQDERILKTPESQIFVRNLGPSSVDLAIRPWVKKEHYSNVFNGLPEMLKTRLAEQGIELPYPQLDVHIYQ